MNKFNLAREIPIATTELLIFFVILLCLKLFEVLDNISMATEFKNNIMIGFNNRIHIAVLISSRTIIHWNMYKNFPFIRH